MAQWANVQGTWKVITNIWANVAGNWKVVNNGWVNVGGNWKQFYSSAFTPYIANSSGTAISTQYYGITLYGYMGSSSAGTYTYTWQYSTDGVTWNTETGTGATGTTTTPGTAVTYTTDATDVSAGVLYIRLKVVYGGNTNYSSNLSLIKRQPILNTTSYPSDPVLSGTAEFGGTLTISTHWVATTTVTNDTLPDYYTATWSSGSGTRTYSSRGSDPNYSATWNQYTIVSGDIGSTVSVYVTAYNNNPNSTTTVTRTSATVTAGPQATGSMRRITMPIAFTGTSQTVWIGTNGYVSTTVDPTTSPGTSWPSAGGVVIGPFVADNYYLNAYTYTDSNNFYIRWQGRGLSEGSQTMDYLMKFYWSSTTVDVYFIQNTTGVTLSTDAIRYPAGTTYQTWSASTAITGMTIPSGMTAVSTAPTANYDDGRVAVTATKPTVPTISVFPQVTPSTGTAGTTTYTSDTGTWNGSPTSYSYQWKYNDQGATFLNIPGATSSSYSPPSNFFTLGYLSPIRCYVTATNAIGNSTPAPSNQVPVNAPISLPSGGTVSISTNTGNYNVGSVITYSTSGWTNSPTSYYLELHNGTNPVLTSDPLRATTTSTSGTYTIQTGDVPKYFKAWATATNSAGSATAFSAQVGPATNYSAPTISASVSPTTGTAGSTTYTASSTPTGNPTPTVTYSWQYLNNFSFSWTQYTTGTTFSPPSNINTLYPNYGWQMVATATNSQGNATSTVSITVNNPVVVVKPTAPTNPINSYNNYSGGTYNYSASWTAPTTGTPPLNYYIQVWGATSATAGTTGSGGSYVNTFGPFTATNCTYSSTYAWNYFQVFASNSAGVSPNSVSSTWQ